MTCDYSLYPKNWKTEIRPRILKRADNKCEECNIKNYSVGYRNVKGLFFHVEELYERVDNNDPLPDLINFDKKPLKIVLTIAHMDHDLGNNYDTNLKALCQRCHLLHDKKQHAETRKKNQAERCGQGVMF